MQVRSLGGADRGAQPLTPLPRPVSRVTSADPSVGLLTPSHFPWGDWDRSRDSAGRGVKIPVRKRRVFPPGAYQEEGGGAECRGSRVYEGYSFLLILGRKRLGHRAY